jgi:hypothetical protein
MTIVADGDSFIWGSELEDSPQTKSRGILSVGVET